MLGAEVPRLSTPPARPLTPATSRGFEAIAFAENVLGLSLMPWQKWALIHGLEMAEDETFRFRTLLVLCARQQGKTTLLQVLALWRIYVDRAGLVIGSAQNLMMAEESWDGAVSLAEGVPDLAAELSVVSRVNGNKFMRLTSGERYRVTAASRRGGRGMSSDLVLLDELREHRDWDAWGAVTKTTMARPAPQICGFSNAGDGRSIVLKSLRDNALASAADRSSTLGIFEWSAPEDCAVDDPAGWAAANPALGHRTSEAAILSALSTDPDEVFRTEVLCQWVTALDVAIPPGLWASLADPQAQRGDAPVFALDVAADHSTASIAVAWRRPDEAVQVMLADHRDGVDWVPERCRELCRTWGGRLIIEATGTAAFLLPSFAPSTKVDQVPRRFYVEAARRSTQPSRPAAFATATRSSLTPLSQWPAGPHLVTPVNGCCRDGIRGCRRWSPPPSPCTRWAAQRRGDPAGLCHSRDWLRGVNVTEHRRWLFRRAGAMGAERRTSRADAPSAPEPQVSRSDHLQEGV